MVCNITIADTLYRNYILHIVARHHLANHIDCRLDIAAFRLYEIAAALLKLERHCIALLRSSNA